MTAEIESGKRDRQIVLERASRDLIIKGTFAYIYYLFFK